MVDKKIIQDIMKKVRQRVLILVINDIHVGSIHAICSAKPIAEGKRYTPNKSQKILLKGFLQCLARFKDQAPDIIIINGEPIDGNNKKGFSKELWSQELVDQVRDFVKLFKLIPQKYRDPKTNKIFSANYEEAKKVAGAVKITKTYLTRGSSYHVDIEGTPIEEFVGDYIDAESINNLKASYHIQMRINDKLLSFAHETGYSKNYPARGNRLAQEWTTHSATVHSKDRWDFSCRAHVHQINERGLGSKWRGISCPAWKYSLGYYFERHGPSGAPADIGMTMIEVPVKGDISYEFLIPDGVALRNKVIEYQ